MASARAERAGSAPRPLLARASAGAGVRKVKFPLDIASRCRDLVQLNDKDYGPISSESFIGDRVESRGVVSSLHRYRKVILGK